MEGIAQPLKYVFKWYNGVVSELSEANERVKHLEAKLEARTHETEIIKNLEKQLDLSREVCNCFERRVQELEGEIAHKLEIAQERDSLKNSLRVTEKTIDYVREERKVTEHRLSVAQARIRVLEGELQDKEDNFKFLQGLIENRIKREMEIKERFAQMRAQIRTLEQERDEALDEVEMWQNRYNEVR